MGTLSHFEPQQQQFFMNSMNSKRNDSGGEARRIIEAAAKLIKSDIKDWELKRMFIHQRKKYNLQQRHCIPANVPANSDCR